MFLSKWINDYRQKTFVYYESLTPNLDLEHSIKHLHLPNTGTEALLRTQAALCYLCVIF